MKRVAWSVSLAFLIAALACAPASYGRASTGTTAPGGTSGSATSTVEFSHSYFSPSSISVAAGETVIFRNVAGMTHHLISPEAGLDTGDFPQGERTFTFSTPGTYTVTNTAHDTTLTVTVRRPGEAAPAPSTEESKGEKGKESPGAYDY